MGKIDPEPGSMKVTQEAIDRYGQGFRAGYNRLTPGQRLAVRDTLLARGLVKNNFYKLLNGDIIPKVTVAAHITQVFARFGIEDPWGGNGTHVTIRRENKEGESDE